MSTCVFRHNHQAGKPAALTASILRMAMVFGVITAFAVTVACAETAYLPAVGPIPLRFYGPLKPFTNHFTLAVAIPETTSAHAAKPAKTKIASPDSSTPPPAPVQIQPELPPLIYGASSPPVESPASSEETISPQVFLKYFNHSTNNTGVNQSIPINPLSNPIPINPPSILAPVVPTGFNLNPPNPAGLNPLKPIVIPGNKVNYSVGQ